MRWRGYRQSGNVVSRGGMIAGGGVGAIVLAVVAMLFGVDPGAILQQAPSGQSADAPAANDSMTQMTRAILASTEDAWSEVFRQSNEDYPEPQLVTFSGYVQSACGTGQSAMGPFYCPRDQAVYVDLSFFDELSNRFGAAGDFAQAYVIAHEIGHHVQHVIGIDEQVRAAQQQNPDDANEWSVRLELQADCFAGVWGHSAAQRNHLDPEDTNEGLTAAAAIGDDRIQRMSGGTVSPEGFTHGSSAQRVEWFRRGLDSGQIESCNTYE